MSVCVFVVAIIGGSAVGFCGQNCNIHNVDDSFCLFVMLSNLVLARGVLHQEPTEKEKERTCFFFVCLFVHKSTRAHERIASPDISIFPFSLFHFGFARDRAHGTSENTEMKA